MTEPARVSVRVWTQRLRADPDITGARLCVLTTFSTYLNSDGSNGRVREVTLAETTGYSLRTVRDHLAWARKNDYLRRVGRGHRLGDGSATASTYEATVPPPTSTGNGLPVESSSQPADRRISTGSSAHLNRQIDASQPADSDIAYKEVPSTDQELYQEQTKGAAGASTKPQTTTAQKPAADMLPMPVAVASPPRGRRRPDPGPPAALDDVHPGRRGMPTATAAGNQLAAEHLAAYPYEPSREVRQWTYTAVEKQLAQGIDPEMVRIGLALLREDQAANPGRDIGPGLLPKYVDQARRGVRPGQRRRGTGFNPNAGIYRHDPNNPETEHKAVEISADEWMRTSA